MNIFASLGFAAFLYGPTPANAAHFDLGTADKFGVLAGIFTNSNTAPQTIINGDVGCSTCTAPQPLTVTGTTFTPKPVQAGLDQAAALATLNGLACTTTTAVVAIDTLPQPLTPGVYCFTGAVSQTLGTTLTLSGDGLYVFRIAGALTTGGNDIMTLTGGASASDVFWVPTGATTIGANNTFVGTVIDDAGISLGHSSTLLGRALAFGGTVTTDANTIGVPTATLRIIKTVINDNGGVTPAAGFNLHVTSGSIDVAGSPAIGVAAPGRAYTLAVGNYVVSEDPNASYSATIGGDCDASGSITLTAGADKTCTITNDDIAPPLGAVTLGKSFVAANINAAGVSTLTITLSNNNAGAATLASALIDTMPNGVVIAPVPNASTTCGAGAPTALAGGSTVTLSAGHAIPGGSPGTCVVSVDVTAPLVGNYIDTMAAGALVTSNGSNASPISATLFVAAVVPPPGAVALGKSFVPGSINAGGVSTLDIALSNNNLTAAILTSPLVDTLPAGVTIAPVPNASTNCGGQMTAIPGASTVTLAAGNAIPGGNPGTCRVTLDVTAPVGNYTNTLGVGVLVTDKGANPAPTSAPLTVSAAAFTPVPSLSEWGMIILAALLALFAFMGIRRQAR